MDQSTKQLTRVLIIAFGALYAYSMIQLVVYDQLKYYLADSKFELLVISGGVLLALITLLKTRATLLPHTGHTHDHDHYGHDHHDHDHDHEHGVSLWRFIILAFPMIIVLTGLAPKGLSSDILDTRMTKAQREAIASASSLPETRYQWFLDATEKIEEIEAQLEGSPPNKSELQAQLDALKNHLQDRIKPSNAKELMAAARSKNSREYWESEKNPIFVRLSGQFQPDQRFTDRYRLSRIKIVCCAADATPVVVTVMGLPQSNWKYGDWLEVVGPVSFFGVDDEKTGVKTYYPAVQQMTVKETVAKNYLQ